MGRRIAVTSNCQLGGLHAALAGMLPDDDLLPVANPAPDPHTAGDSLNGVDVWVTSTPRAEIDSIAATLDRPPTVIRVPVILFTGFHPDLVHLLAADGTEIDSGVGTYSSAIVAWGWQHGLGAAEILDRFTPAVFDALGYHDAWVGALELTRFMFERVGADFDRWYLPLASRGAFMLTDNHPRLDAIVQLARPVAERLGARPELVAHQWEQVIPDGLLATGTVWPLYPSVAAALDLPGAYVWRCDRGQLVGLEEFVQRSLDRYAAYDPTQTTVARFQRDDRWERVLADSPR